MSRHFVVIKVQTKQEKKNYQEKMSHLTKFIVCCSDKTYTSVSAQTHEKGIYLFLSDHIKNKRHARKHVLFSHLLCFFLLTLCSLYTIVKFSKNKKNIRATSTQTPFFSDSNLLHWLNKSNAHTHCHWSRFESKLQRNEHDMLVLQHKKKRSIWILMKEEKNTN